MGGFETIQGDGFPGTLDVESEVMGCGDGVQDEVTVCAW